MAFTGPNRYEVRPGVPTQTTWVMPALLRRLFTPTACGCEQAMSVILVPGF
jgi:hypothetical protein